MKEDATKATVGHIVDSVCVVVIGAIQLPPTHKVTSMKDAKMIQIVTSVGNVQDHVLYNIFFTILNFCMTILVNI